MEEVLNGLGVLPEEGLTGSEARTRLIRYGPPTV
ncbi:MAG: cation-transporting P-type ATPase [Thermodesulfobacteriota bacterium]